MVGGSDVWGFNKTHEEGGVVSLAISADTNGSSQVSSTIGFKSTWEKEDLENKGTKRSLENCERDIDDVIQVTILTGQVGFPVSSSKSLSISWISILHSDSESTC